MKKPELELYTDYLISTFGAATATGLSAMVNGDISHDHMTRFLSEREYTSKDLWLQVKSTVRKIEQDDAVVIFDDTIQEKQWTDENEIMCWHFDHVVGRSVRGINLLNALYYSGGVAIPIGFEVIRKPIQFCEIATQKVKRESVVTKNELMRDMLDSVIKNQLKFKYVLILAKQCFSWFGSVENFNFIVKKKKHFIVALKNNRLIALSAEDKKQGRYVRIDSLELSDKQAMRGWLKDYQHEVLIVRQVFTNKDGSIGLLNLACSDLTCDGDQITSTYKKRWHVEVFHKSLKSNASLAKSPTRRVTTQNNHVFMSIYAVYKLECLKIKHKLNHFALRMKLLITATQQSFSQLKIWQAA